MLSKSILFAAAMAIVPAVAIDIVFIVDESGSMGTEQATLRAEIPNIFSGIATQQPGSRAALVGFGRSSTGGDPRLHQALTTDQTAFTTAAQGLIASGSVEPGLLAIIETADNDVHGETVGHMGPFCAVIFTDEPDNGSGKTSAEAQLALTNNGAALFSVTNNQAHYDSIAVKSYSLDSFNGATATDMIDDIIAECAAVVRFPTANPTESPEMRPRELTEAPTQSPTKYPTESPTKYPTQSPTKYPTQSPTKYPTQSPTKYPTTSPTDSPTESPTKYPTTSPTDSPTSAPTASPTPYCERFDYQFLDNPAVYGNGAGADNMGFSVAAGGNVIVSGVPYDEESGRPSNSGKAYVHLLDKDKMIIKSGYAELTIPNGLAHKNDNFGYSVSVTKDGDTIIVGAPRDNIGSGRKGVVHVFSRASPGSPHTHQVSLGGVNVDAGGWFGRSTAIWEYPVPTATTSALFVAGASGKPGSTTGFAGVAEVYRKLTGSGNWAHATTLYHPAAGINDRFGWAVDVKGNRVVVSAPQRDGKRGAVYVFKVNKNGVQVGAAQEITSPACVTSYATCAGDSFGEAVSMSPDTKYLAIGAPLEERFGSSAKSGHVHMYRWHPYQLQYVFHSTLVVPRPNGSDGTPGGSRFGAALSLLNDVLAVGAWKAPTKLSTRAGAMYPFYLTPGGVWDLGTPHYKATGYKSDDRFGFSVAACDDYLVVGEPRDEYSGGGSTNTGSSWVLKRQFYDGCVPTESPTKSPTTTPTSSPTDAPTKAPTMMGY